MTHTLARPWLAGVGEMVGTMWLVLFAAWAVVALAFPVVLALTPSTFLFIGALPAAAIFFSIISLEDLTGAHFNPAVSLGALAAGKIGWGRWAWYLLFQIIGGILGALILWGI